MVSAAAKEKAVVTDIVLWYGKTEKRGIAGKHPRTRQSLLLYTLFFKEFIRTER